MEIFKIFLITSVLHEKFSIYYCTSVLKPHSGPHVCRSRSGERPCCPGWEQRDHDQLCLSPICTNGCGKYGICVSPNVCQCQDGVTAPACLNTLSESQNLCNDFVCHQQCDMKLGYPTCSCFVGFKLHEDMKTCVEKSKQQFGFKSRSMGKNSFSRQVDGSIDQEATDQLQLCPHGYIYNKVLGFCNDINECKRSRKRLKCSQICINMLGTYRCSCYQGYSLRLDKHRCTRQKMHHDSCTPQCANGGTCVNGKCYCKSGLNGNACEKDVNECLELDSICEYKCQNTFGSFRCSCHQGYILNADFRSCRAMSCVPECMNGGTCIGGKCICPVGFKGKSCGIDRNECKEDLVSCEYMCRNTYGSYVCLCPPRSWLKADKHSCTYTKLCLHKCRNGGTCITGKCLCPPGLTGLTCLYDQNECSLGTNGCSHGCYNTYGSFRCYCPRGMILSTNGKTCVASETRKPESVVDKTTLVSQCYPPCRFSYLCVDGNCKCVDTSKCSTVSPMSSVIAITSSPKVKGIQRTSTNVLKTVSTTLRTHPANTVYASTTTSSLTHFSGNGKKVNSKNYSVSIDGKELDMKTVSSVILKNLEVMRNSNKTTKSEKKLNSKSDITHYKEPSDGFVLAVNKNIMKSMMNDFKSRRRAINGNGKKSLNSGILVSAASDFPCFYMGSKYNSGVVFSPDKHNCTRCECNNGELRCNRQSCPKLDCPNPVRGHCCNRCPDDCVFDMKIRRNGDNFSPKNDPCKTCYCSAGLVTCTDAPCPILDCPMESQFLPPGQCCAECLIVKKTVSKTVRNIKGCRHRNILYDIGDNWVDAEDKCTVCECQDRDSVECFSLECLKDLCDNGLVKGCCSICNECSLSGARMSSGDVRKQERNGICEECTCQFGELTCRVKPCQSNDCQIRMGKQIFFYKHGDIFNLPNDPCVQCSCAKGAMSCFASECSVSCSHGVKNVTQCCSPCKECSFEGRLYRNLEQYVMENSESCRKCRCVEGNVSCRILKDCKNV